jgi:hypothetical protein
MVGRDEIKPTPRLTSLLADTTVFATENAGCQAVKQAMRRHTGHCIQLLI